MNSAEKEVVLHCLKSMIDEALCEECPLYGTTGTDHCEKDCVRLAINALSRSENPNKWIPVSERLPEEGEEVLVSGYDTYNKKVIVARYQGEQYGFTCGLVSAWMPLPEPYKSEVDE